MKKLLLTLTLFIGVVSLANAQVYFEEEASDSTSFKDRLYFGGNFSFNLGTRFTFIDVSPLAGYMINDDFSVGVGTTYLYLSREFLSLPSGNRFTIKNSVYGGRTFLRHSIFDSFFAHAEFESLNTEIPTFDGAGGTTREWVPGLLIGGGTFQPVFGRGGVNVTVLLNLLHDDFRSPYNSAIVFRGGITF